MTDLPPFIDSDRLDRLAEVAVRVGLNLQPGQNLVISASTGTLPLVRRVAAAAYRAGAGLVTPMLTDEAVTPVRFANAGETSFDVAPGWLFDGLAAALDQNTAQMSIRGDDPMLLAEQDPAKVARQGKANSIASRPALERITRFDVNWTVLAYPGAAWARQVFPHLSEDEAVASLAEAIFAASRVNEADPVSAWTAHSAALRARTDWLNGQAFHALHYTGPGTDLTIGLADGHKWQGGSSTSRNGIICNPNIPTEEVFTTPHAQRVDGVVKATKPLAHQGNVIDGIEVRFEAGRIVDARAKSGEDAFKKLISIDDGAARLGEVALVPHSSPISQSGVLFYNTLFDENAASHVALGQCYSECFMQGDLTKEQVASQGGNSSLIHVDWMIGSGEIDIDGLDANGDRTPVMRQGEWAS